MFKNLTYKQKFLAVIIGFIILSMASYKKTFKHVLKAKKELNNIEQKLITAENSYNDIYYLKNEINHLDNIIGGQTLRPENVQQTILNFITQSGFKTDVISIDDAHLFSNEEFLIYTNQIEIEGSYKNLINLLYDIEKNFKNSRIISVNIYSKKNYRTNLKKLFLKIILQNYEKTN